MATKKCYLIYLETQANHIRFETYLKKQGVPFETVKISAHADMYTYGNEGDIIIFPDFQGGTLVQFAIYKRKDHTAYIIPEENGKGVFEVVTYLFDNFVCSLLICCSYDCCERYNPLCQMMGNARCELFTERLYPEKWGL